MKEATPKDALIALLLLPFMVLLEAFVIRRLWGWFVVALIGVPTPSYPVAVGLSCLMAILAHQHIPEGASEGKWEPLFRGLFRMGYQLLIGWVAHFYV